ncbi:M50 family metallopeptidase [Paenibacillus sp. strain BS8-2]
MFSWLRGGLIFIVVLILTRFIPFSSFFRNVNTLVHELAHAAAALVLQGKVMEIHLFADQSGVTYTQFQEGWMLIPIALAGYIGASLYTVLLFAMYAKGRIKQGLLLVSFLALAAVILFVRNGYGITWSAGFAIVTTLIALIGPNWLQKGYYLLIAFLSLVESVVSSLVILYMALVSPATAGDTHSLSSSTGVPAIVWGLLFAAIALWCAKASLGHLFGKRKSV